MPKSPSKPSKDAPRKTFLTHAQRQEVISRSQAGESPRVLAKEFGVTKRRVMQLRHTPLHAPYRRLLSRDEEAQALRLARGGASHREIGQALGIATGSVGRVLARARRAGGKA